MGVHFSPSNGIYKPYEGEVGANGRAGRGLIRDGDKWCCGRRGVLITL
jgi:hypothetical protein